MRKQGSSTERPIEPISRKLSPLELTVLGNLMLDRGCTAYGMVQHFKDSKSEYYRSGAGSIYPLMKRLAKAGLATAERSESGDETFYQITESGLAAVREWFRPPFDEMDFSCSLDIIRSRAYFLGILSPDECSVYLDQMLKGLRVLLGQLELNMEESRSEDLPFVVMALEGALRETQARIEWVEWMKGQLGAY